MNTRPLSFYRWQRALQLLIVFQVGLSLLAAVEPFLFVKPLGECLYRTAGGILSFVTCALTWHYLKAFNGAAAQAILQIAEAQSL
jgi:hypothetical protein